MIYLSLKKKREKKKSSSPFDIGVVRQPLEAKP